MPPTSPPPPGRTSPLVAPAESFASVTDQVSDLTLRRPTSWRWLVSIAFTSALTLLLLYAIGYLLIAGVGIWGVNVPVSWGHAIINFVWWIGIGHAGTLISATLLLLHQGWRKSLSRFSEAMTIFAIACGGLFPLLHMGRPWFFHWMLPYPNTYDVAPQFRSALVWDVWALSAYAIVSILLWYVGMLPDLATLRDQAQKPFAGRLLTVLSLGWRGSARHWQRYESAYAILAGLATALVVSVHSIEALVLSATVVPGWHSTVYPPFFIAGAILSGLAMILVLLIPARRIYGLRNLITDRHLQNIAKIMLATSLLVGYGYLMEWFAAIYSGRETEEYLMVFRAWGPWAACYWAMVISTLLAPQLLWLRAMRSSSGILFILGLVVLIGMWLQRYLIVVSSLERDYLPSASGIFFPTFWDWATFAGTFGLFLTMFLLFVRLLPIVSMSEVRTLIHPAVGPVVGEDRP